MKKGLLIALLTPFIGFAQQPELIPAPQKMEATGKSFVWKQGMSFYCPPAFENTPCKLTIWGLVHIYKSANAKKANVVVTALPKPRGYHSEYYKLSITPKQIRIAAYTDTGVFRACMTLLQMLPADYVQTKQTGFPLPCVNIEDRPAFNYRGLHLDVCRHFFPVSFIKRYIDDMALFKYNVFHWHLTEDQGWRIEIKKYPKLTEVGAWRNGSQKGRYAEHRFDSLRYGGFYTQEEVKEIVEYARQRYITVIPEIEMPGHSLAALAAYPQLSCTGGPFEVAKGWGVFDDVYCAGNDTTLNFLKDVLSEVLTLFPSKYIHIGGDECPKTRWKICPKCQNRMKLEGLKDEHELQSWFVQHIEKWLNEKGRSIIGWDEILEGGLAPNATVMSWRGTAGGEEAAKQGHNVIMTPGKPCYFDHYQSKDSTEPIAIGGYNPLQAVYDYSPVPTSLGDLSTHVLGAQGNVWTEYMETEGHVEYMVWPRAAALAEALWTGTGRDYQKFLKNLPSTMKQLETRGVNHARHFSKKP